MIKQQFSSIQPGAVYKNYKELCEAIGEKPKTSDSKKKQLREIEEWIKLRKEGWTYIVEEVYEKRKISFTAAPIEKSTEKKKRGRPPTKTSPETKNPRKYIFSKYIEAVLMNYMLYKSKKGENPVSLGKLELYQMLGVVNIRFGNSGEEVRFLYTHEDIDYKELNYVKRQALEKLRPMIYQVLNSLERRRLLFHHWYFVIKEINGSTHIATPADEEKILWAEKRTLEEMGYDSISQVYGFRKVHEYYSNVKEKIYNFGWDYYSQRVRLIFNEEHIIAELEKTEQELLKIELNDNFCNYLGDKMQKDWREKHLAFATDKVKEMEEKDPERALIRLPFEECMEKHKVISDYFIRYIQRDDKFQKNTENKNTTKENQ